MKNLFVIITVTIFLGVSAATLYSSENDNPKSCEKRVECTTAVAKSDCGADGKVQQTADTKNSACESSAKAVKTAGSEKASDCSQPCGSKAANQTAGSSDECSSKKSDGTKVADRP